MSSLRIIYRCLFAAVCSIALAAVLIFAHYTRMQDPAAPVSFFTYFSAPPNPALPILDGTPVQNIPAPNVKSRSANQAAALGEEENWLPLSQGKTAGKGAIEALTPLERADGSLELRLPYTGKVGQYTVYTIYRPTGYILTVALYGDWTKGPNLKRTIRRGDIKRLWAANHPQAYRVSVSGRDMRTPLDVDVSASTDVIRFVFNKTKSREPTPK